MKNIVAVMLVGFVVSGCAYGPGYYRPGPVQDHHRDDRDYRNENRQPAYEPVSRRDREYQRDGDQRRGRGDEGRGRTEQRRGDHEQRREERD